MGKRQPDRSPYLSICGATTEREQVNPDSMISGLVKCTRRGSEGDLNIEIIERQDAARPQESVEDFEE